MERLRLLLLASTVAACADGKPDRDTDTTDTDVADDTDHDVDTDTVDTDVVPPSCDDLDACDGCEPVGASVSCDCTQEVALDPSTCRPIRVAVLDDDADSEPSSGSYIVPMLEDATWDGVMPMFTVTDLGRRWGWTGGIAPISDTAAIDTGDTDAPSTDLLSVDNTDVVLLLQGTDYQRELMPRARTVLDAFVAGGGGLIRTEWGASYRGLEAELSPVEKYDRYLEDAAPKTWELGDDTSPYASIVHADLPASFTLAASLVEAVPRDATSTGDVATETLITAVYDRGGEHEPYDVPAVVVWPHVASGDAPHGTILWLNHDLAYLGGDAFDPMAETEFEVLLRNVTRAGALQP